MNEKQNVRRGETVVTKHYIEDDALPRTRAERRRASKKSLSGETVGRVCCKHCYNLKGTLEGTRFICNTPGCEGSRSPAKVIEVASETEIQEAKGL